MLSEQPPTYDRFNRMIDPDLQLNVCYLLDGLIDAEEASLQRMKPAKPQFYARNMRSFLREFLHRNPLETQMTPWDGIYLIGRSEWHPYVMEEIMPDRWLIETTSKMKVENIFIFLGSGMEMNLSYRSIGGGVIPENGKYELAIAGAKSCFLNIDEGETGSNFYLQQNVNSRRHEFRHVAIDSVLDRKTGVPNTSRINRTVHEALGGPDELAWRMMRTKDVQVDFSGLQGNNFYQWLHDEEARLGCGDQIFFESPVVKKFYLDYVYPKGDFKHWFNLAVKLGKEEHRKNTIKLM